ncbi:hypothetical protein MMB17_07505 [Methylobacterium organophilum]|uniref:hypothetical protein n=1 Tax=Methylobacterium organophilum TaxID=410 RepID=UPI001F12F891|nr:hypothetical protein [Methylobacterium organophilum]UMY19136.1 hypothetical protein MMB17_07505 [Methylobacterium organophilum]
MAGRIIEAKAVISGEDRLSKVIEGIDKRLKSLGKGVKVSADVERLNQSLANTRRQLEAIDRINAAQSKLSSARLGLNGAQQRADRLALELAAARKVQDAKAVTELTAQSKVAQRAVNAATAAVERQAAELGKARRAFAEFGVPVENLVAHERALKASVEQTTAALHRQAAEQRNLRDVASQTLAKQQAAERRQHEIGKLGVGHALAYGAAGYVGVHSVAHGIGDTIHAGARYQHEVVALQNAGRTPEEMREIEHASLAATAAVPTATYEENLKVINETTGAFGSLHHAIENLPFMQKSAFALKMSAGDKVMDGPGELGNKLARFFEMRGTAGNTPVFQREAGEMMRAMIFTRGNFNPGEMVNFAQQAKASLPLYSERFMSKIVPSLVTEFGGDRAGTGANAFRNVIMGKANDKKQAEEWVNLGLLDKNMAIMKGGHAVSWKAGAVKDTNTALTDPLEWAEKTLIPALRKKGVDVDDKLELSKALGTLFRNSNSNMFAEALSQKLSRQRLHKDEDSINKAGTLDEVYQRNLGKDPTATVKAVTAALENLASAASSPAMETAAGLLNTLAERLNAIANVAKEHPAAALAGGTAVAGAGLAGAGWMSYQLLNGFGLGKSAAALDVSAGLLNEAAVALGAQGAGPKAAAAAAGAGAGAGRAGTMLPLLAGAGLPLAGAAALTAVLVYGSDETKGIVHGGRPDISVNPSDELPGLPAAEAQAPAAGGSKIVAWWRSRMPTWMGGDPSTPLPVEIKAMPENGGALSGPKMPGSGSDEAGGNSADGKSPITAEVKTLPPLSGEVTGQASLTGNITVEPSQWFTTKITGLENQVMQLSGKVSSLVSNGPGSTGKSSPDAGRGGRD